MKARRSRAAFGAAVSQRTLDRHRQRTLDRRRERAIARDRGGARACSTCRHFGPMTGCANEQECKEGSEWTALA